VGDGAPPPVLLTLISGAQGLAGEVGEFFTNEEDDEHKYLAIRQLRTTKEEKALAFNPLKHANMLWDFN
jgi:hypothetical protein